MIRIAVSVPLRHPMLIPIVHALSFAAVSVVLTVSVTTRRSLQNGNRGMLTDSRAMRRDA